VKGSFQICLLLYTLNGPVLCYVHYKFSVYSCSNKPKLIYSISSVEG
jgi:hypothetical protein